MSQAAEKRSPGHIAARLLMIALAMAALVGCWAVAVHLRDVASMPGARVDAAWATRINAHHSHLRDVVAGAIAVAGGFPVGVLIDLIVAALVLVLRGTATCLAMLAALGINEADVLLMKWVSERSAPGSSSLFLGFLGSFPSGHTANAAVLVVFLGTATDGLLVWAGGAAYVTVMAIDRTYLDAHWLTDTVAGAVAGAAVAAIVWSVANPQRRQRPTPHRGVPPVPSVGAAGHGQAATSSAVHQTRAEVHAFLESPGP